eukprot:TRINITY_DN24920_c0_g1_i4.p1 TRINITY_DN24920_c0_g1~~TRINITY_DN24920_c0_g1_i4.p1  ORF type:complete len:177 (+),score=25.78 TRINITY_DN24920_c0_g1_i4:91-621(+)
MLPYRSRGLFFFFFFKQKTAYEMQRGLVGSEMCIRDRYMGNLSLTVSEITGWSLLAGIILSILLILTNCCETQARTIANFCVITLEVMYSLYLIVLFIIVQVYLFKKDNDCVEGWKAMYIWALIYVISFYITILFYIVCLVCMCFGFIMFTSQLSNDLSNEVLHGHPHEDLSLNAQ